MTDDLPHEKFPNMTAAGITYFSSGLMREHNSSRIGMISKPLRRVSTSSFISFYFIRIASGLMIKKISIEIINDGILTKKQKQICYCQMETLKYFFCMLYEI